MHHSSAIPGAFLTAGFLLALFLGWALLAPSIVGGPATYVVTAGASMEPRLNAGDLAILRRQPSVSVGDIVGFKSAATGQAVLHRVIEVRGDGTLRTQGDANGWVDPEMPAAADVLGTLWTAVPGGGRVARAVGSPLGAGLAVGGAVAMALAAPGGRTARRWRRRGRWIPGSALDFASGEAGQVLVGTLAAAAVIACGAVTWAHLTPTTEATRTETAYLHTARFEYEAPVTLPFLAPVGDPAAAALVASLGAPVTTGQPIFVSLSPVATLTVHYALATDVPVDLHGTIEVGATVKDVNGWTARYPLVAEVPFSSTDATVEAVLPLEPVMQHLAMLREITGRNTAEFHAVLAAQIVYEGTVAGEAVSGEFVPQLTFHVRPPNELYMETREVHRYDLPFYELQQIPENPFFVTEPGAVWVAGEAPRRVSLAFADAEVWTLRVVAVAALILTLAAVAGLTWLAQRAEARPAWERIRGRFGHLLVRGTSPAPEAGTVLASFEDLARLAQHHGSLIVWSEHDGLHHYSLEADHRVYAYRVAGA